MKTFIYTCVLLIGLVTSQVFSQKPKDIARKVFPSVVMLVMEDENGQPLSLGSGFFVKEHIIATNLHVIKNAEKGYAKLIGKKPKYSITGFVAVDVKTDLALLEIEGVKSSPLSIGDSKKMEVGDEVYAVGNPEGLEGTFSQGIVSGIRQLESFELLQITAPISPGSSGGPVLNNRAEVVGVAVATFKEGQNLNFAIPSISLFHLIQNISSVKHLSMLPHSPSSNSSNMEIGASSTDAIIGENFLWLMRGSGDFTFSLRNTLSESINEINCLLVFYDSYNKPVDIYIVRYSGTIPAGLAKRVEGKVHWSVQDFVNPYHPREGREGFNPQPENRIEFRILDFRIVH